MASDSSWSRIASRSLVPKSMSSSTGLRNWSAWCPPTIEMHRSYLITSALIFAAVAILHFLRLINDWDFVLGPWSIPRWVSWAGTAFPACLSAWALSGIEKVVSLLATGARAPGRVGDLCS